jgi:hypothetical protein
MEATFELCILAEVGNSSSDVGRKVQDAVYPDPSDRHDYCQVHGGPRFGPDPVLPFPRLSVAAVRPTQLTIPPLNGLLAWFCGEAHRCMNYAIFCVFYIVIHFVEPALAWVTA